MSFTLDDRGDPVKYTTIPPSIDSAEEAAEKLFEDVERGYFTRGQVWALDVLYCVGTGLLLVWIFGI